MSTNVARAQPDPETVGRRAAVILDAVRADDDFDRLAGSASRQAGWSTSSSPWSCRSNAVDPAR